MIELIFSALITILPDYLYRRHKQGKRHLLIKKNAKRKRKLGKATLVSDADLPRLKLCMPHG